MENTAVWLYCCGNYRLSTNARPQFVERRNYCIKRFNYEAYIGALDAHPPQPKHLLRMHIYFCASYGRLTLLCAIGLCKSQKIRTA